MQFNASATSKCKPRHGDLFYLLDHSNRLLSIQAHSLLLNLDWIIGGAFHGNPSEGIQTADEFGLG